MEFSVVDIPKNTTTSNTPLIEALLKNVGKAISIPCGSRDANNVRKTLRASLSNRGILDKFNFRSRIEMVGNALIAWLEPRKTGPSEEQTAEFQKDKR